MILIDSRRHMVSDYSLKELHAFAHLIGLSRARFHGARRGHPHYDLTVRAVSLASILWATHGQVSYANTRTLIERMVRQ